MRIFALLTVLVLASDVAFSATLKDNYAHFASLDQYEKYLMYWTMDDDRKEINIALSVQTTGWIGFGISPYTGRMPGSDTVIAWVDASQRKTYLQVQIWLLRNNPVKEVFKFWSSSSISLR